MIANPFVRIFITKIVQVVAFEVARSGVELARPHAMKAVTNVHRYFANRKRNGEINVKF